MDIINVVEWSRAQFALTACYHWLFVPLTLGLGIIVAVMETVYYRTRKQEWLSLTKFWMTLFGVNFAIGVATGIILEFEFGTNFSNYSWFVGDIFGAPLAIEGIFAFFCESTFFAVMFFGWKKFSAAGWLARDIIANQLTCPSMLCILSLQDWFALDEKLRLPDADAERINIPANPRHYWRYRMHIDIEDLIADKEYNDAIKELVKLR